ncbi:MAG: ISNCY family transposase [Actinomycetota bacterium]|jgi:IS5 family transposase|nr:ISNCY family transposase [Actinomycetota bacterium]
MLRLHDGQATLWEQLLPEVVHLLPEELTRIDALLDDEGFLAPFVRRFNCRIGRPTVPIDSYLRLMYLKHRHGLGYETLVKEVADSLSWRRFCRIRLEGGVPHPTTLMKLTRRFGVATLDDLNATLLDAAVERKVLRSRRLRVDTTVVEADVRYPTDSGLCAHAVSRLTRAVRAVKATGLAAKTRFRSRVTEAGEAVRRMSHTLGRVRGRAAVDRITSELHQLAGDCASEAKQVLEQAGRATGSRALKGKLAVARLAEEIRRAEIVIGQTSRRLAGETAIPDRVVSLADLDARPIRRGKPQRPTEFGYKVSIADSVEGFVVSHQVYVGAVGDTSTLKAAVTGAKATGMRVLTVYADRGYGNEVADQVLDDLKIPRRVIPRQGRAAPEESTPSWRRRYRHRAGAEGRISHLKRRYGLTRSRLKGHPGATLWVGYGVLAHNLDKMVALG